MGIRTGHENSQRIATFSGWLFCSKQENGTGQKWGLIVQGNPALGIAIAFQHSEWVFEHVTYEEDA